ncbi:MAG: hypothetical protein HYZ92_01740 [Candidatus Omnitrophica bacterium]|nr:hypothetical protein [Candidatus Omnitrophota bacterium]
MPQSFRRSWPWLLGALAAGGLFTAAHLASGAETKREPKLDTAAIERKLNEILNNQTAILQQLDAMMEELKIIKVRATR